MPKYDDFDLDLKKTESESNNASPYISSMSACTPGTCWGCKPSSFCMTWCCSVLKCKR